MKFILILTLVILSSNILSAQQSFEEIDKQTRKYHRNQLFKIKRKDQDGNFIYVYFYKADKQLFFANKLVALKHNRLV